jgi:hypothetical protein
MELYVNDNGYRFNDQVLANDDFKLPSIRGFNFDANLNDPKVMKRFMVAMPKVVRSLTMCRCHISDVSAQILASHLPPNLEYLAISNNRFGDTGLHSIAVAIDASHSLQTHLQELYISACRIHNTGFKFIVDVLIKCALHTLDVSTNDIDSLGVARIAEVLPDCQIRVLNLSSNPIGNLGVSRLAQYLPTSHLEELQLYGCEISDLGARNLFSAVSKSSTLNTLNVGSNYIHDVSARSIATMVSTSNLTDLCISFCRFSDLILHELTSALPDSLLQCLRVRSNTYHSDSICRITAVLPDTFIRILDVSPHLHIPSLRRVLSCSFLEEIPSMPWIATQKTASRFVVIWHEINKLMPGVLRDMIMNYVYPSSS